MKRDRLSEVAGVNTKEVERLNSDKWGETEQKKMQAEEQGTFPNSELCQSWNSLPKKVEETSLFKSVCSRMEKHLSVANNLAPTKGEKVYLLCPFLNARV